MFPAERRQVLLSEVLRTGAASLRQLCELTDASEVTLRRDLRELESQGLLVRSRGGALAPPDEAEPSYLAKTRVAPVAKTEIARAAAELVDDGDSVILGAGSTTQLLAQALVRRRDLTVITNSLLVAQALASAPGVDVVVTGGHLRGSTFALIGAAAEQSLSALRASTAFLSGNGMTAERGLSTPHSEVASMDSAMAAAAQDVVVLADHTKIGVDTLMQTVPPERIGMLITDAAANPDELRCCRDAGIDVVVCGN